MRPRHPCIGSAHPQLDHIIIRVPSSFIQNPPPWLKAAFTIAPGGRHGDGKTENRLIVFADGTYLELVAFTSAQAEQGHFWGGKGYGIIDYALTLEAGAEAYEHLRTRWELLDLPQGWKPGPLQYGSRTRPDGVKIEWRVAFPDKSARGRAPFWCFDVTPREKRVPTDSALTEHPCGAKGVAGLILFRETTQYQDLENLLNAMIPQVNKDRPDNNTWDLETPHKVDSKVPCALSLMPPKGSYVEGALKRRGLVARLTLFTDGREEETGRQSLQEAIEGDELLIGFVSP
ncbi:MAG: hypothetical protein Q9162_003980 [Coniocarpon cinnabarinum]